MTEQTDWRGEQAQLTALAAAIEPYERYWLHERIVSFNSTESVRIHALLRQALVDIFEAELVVRQRAIIAEVTHD